MLCMVCTVGSCYDLPGDYDVKVVVAYLGTYVGSKVSWWANLFRWISNSPRHT